MASAIPGQRSGVLRENREILRSTKGVRRVQGTLDATHGRDGSNTNYEWELRAGQPLAQVTATKKWVPVKRSRANGNGNASATLVVEDARAFVAGETVAIGGNQTFRLGKVKDSDSAAATGTAVYLHLDELGESPFGHLESVNAGNADSSFQIGVNGPVVKVEDDDAAATAGTQIYFDEDAADPDSRFLSNIGIARDAFVLASDGRAIRIKYDASASSNGVAVYFDDDGGTTSERLLFVSPTNADGRYHTDDDVTTAVASSTVTRTTGATISSINYGTNTLTLSGSTSWADGDAVYCDSLPGSETCRGFLNEHVDLKDDRHQLRDMQTGEIVVAGFLATAQILGDLAAIRADSQAELSHIQWDDEHGLT